MAKITFVLPGYPRHPVGGYKMAYHYANCLADVGHQVSVMHARSRSLAAESLLKRIALHSFYRMRSERGPAWFQLRSNVNVRNFPELRPQDFPQSDILIATAVSTARPVYEASGPRTRGLYLIQGFEDFAAPREAVIDTWRLPLRKVVVSEWLREMAESLGLETVLVENGVDETLFYSNGDEARPLDVLALVSDQAVKRSDLVIAVLNELSETRPDLRCQTFGVIDRPKHLADAVTHVKAPAPKRLAAMYRSAKTYLCTSDFEGFGLPALEAMACGAAVISTDNGGVPAFAGDAAVYAPVGTPDGLKQKLLEVLNDSVLRRTLQHKGHVRSLDLTLTRTGARFTSIIEDELGRLHE